MLKEKKINTSHCKRMNKLKLPFDQGITKQIIFSNWNPYHKDSVQLSSCLPSVSPGKMKDDKQLCDPNDKKAQLTVLPCFASPHPNHFKATKPSNNKGIFVPD